MTKDGEMALPGLSENGVGIDVSLIRELTPVMLWIPAVLVFVVGDVVTTGIGYQMHGVYEVSPLPAFLLSKFGIVALLVLKLSVAAVCYVMWTVVPREYGIAIPIGMMLLGGFATIWNIGVILGAI